MTIKIVLEKAYNKLEWCFIREMLVKFNFLDNLIELVMSCVFYVSTSLLFNGGCLKLSGIRQGDSLSLYLFIMCMEYLGYLIEGKCTTKHWLKVKAFRDGSTFSHLFC